jgi:TRAP-type mannitol/chloroaromatic compound transport system permease large subunit
MVLWIYIGALIFTAVYQRSGAVHFISNTINALEVSPWVILIGMQLSLFILGMFLDPIGIMMITLPVYLPILEASGFDLIWFGVLLVINMEMGYLTPPFGFNLFYMKGIAVEGTTMPEIYRGAIPFIALQMIGLIIVMVFPQIVLYLPNLLMGAQ